MSHDQGHHHHNPDSACCGGDHAHQSGASTATAARRQAWLEYGMRLAALSAWAIVMLYFTYHGEMKIYLSPIFQSLAALGAHLLGIVAIIYGFVGRPGQESEEFCCDHHLDSHAGTAVFGGLVLILPVSLAAMTSPDSFSETVLRNRGVGQGNSTFISRSRPPQSSGLAIDSQYIMEGDIADEGADLEQSPDELPQAGIAGMERSIDQYLAAVPRDADGYLELTTLDLLYGAQNEVLRNKLMEKEVSIIGQYMREPSQGKAGYSDWLVRMAMVCCAADAQPAAVQLTGTEPPAGLDNAGWVRIKGRPSYTPGAPGEFEVSIETHEIVKTEMPSSPFLY